jgi:hypothetical protein
VIDASIAKEAGGQLEPHRRGAECRRFLAQVRSIGHRFATSRELQQEWSRHAADFAKAWYTAMVNRRKVHVFSSPGTPELEEIFLSLEIDDDVRRIIAKDLHLLNAALASENRVASLDDQARGHIVREFRASGVVANIIWVNPCCPEHRVIDWLENGAQFDPELSLARE